MLLFVVTFIFGRRRQLRFDEALKHFIHFYNYIFLSLSLSPYLYFSHFCFFSLLSFFVVAVVANFCLCKTLPWFVVIVVVVVVVVVVEFSDVKHLLLPPYVLPCL